MIYFWVKSFIQCYVLIIIKFFEITIVLEAATFEVPLVKNGSTLTISITQLFFFWAKYDPLCSWPRNIYLRHVLCFRDSLDVNFV